MRYDPKSGESIEDAAAALVARACSTKGSVTMEFNAVKLTAKPNDSVYFVLKCFHKEMFDRHGEANDHAELLTVPERGRRQRETALKEELLKAPENLSLQFPADWLKFFEDIVLDDEFNKHIYRYAIRWGRLMEGRMQRGSTLQQCARETRVLANNEGRMSYFMYGEAVSILVHIWKHGEELRRWHNTDTRPGAEGAAANERKEEVLLPTDPSILSFG